MKLEDIKSICDITVKQSDNSEWFDYRKGRLTASKFRKVYTKMNSLRKDESKDYTKAVSDLMGYNKKPPTDDIKYGSSMEMHC